MRVWGAGGGARDERAWVSCGARGCCFQEPKGKLRYSDEGKLNLLTGNCSNNTASDSYFVSAWNGITFEV
jgi:hypothetical protein